MSPAAQMALGAAAAVTIARSDLPAPILSSHARAQSRRVWRLEEPYRYDAGEYSLHLPEGFEFDLASVPRAFWPLISPLDLSIVAPLLHDFLYGCAGRPPYGTVAPWVKMFERAEADQLFREVMKREGVPAWRRSLAYAAVRTFGAGAWRTS